jgi:hypothetical protein
MQLEEIMKSLNDINLFIQKVSENNINMLYEVHLNLYKIIDSIDAKLAGPNYSKEYYLKTLKELEKRCCCYKYRSKK